MKFDPEKMPQIPEISLEAKYLKQGIEVQELLNEALREARLRKEFIQKGMPEEITLDKVKTIKKNYDKAARELASLREEFSPKQKEKYLKLDAENKLDTLEDFQKAYTKEMSKTQELSPIPKTEPKKDPFIPKPDTDFIAPETRPDRDFIPPEPQPDRDFMTDLTEEQEK